MDLSSPTNRSKLVITIGFTTIIVFLLLVLGLWIDSVVKNENILKEIAESQLETRQIATMRNAAYRRALALHRISIMDDPFEQEEEERRFFELGGIFIQNRNEVLSKPMSFRKKEAWDLVRNTLNKGSRAQNNARELILNEQREEGNKILLEEVVPTQDVFVKGISDILDLERSSVERKVAEVIQRNQTTYWLIGFVSTVAILLFFFTIYVVRKTGKTEEALMNQGKRIRELYEVSSRAGLDLDEQIIEMLRLGKRLLNLEIARVCKINPEAQTNTFLYVDAPESYNIKTGKIVPLDKSFCSITYSSDGALAIDNISLSKYAHTPFHEFSRLESYIAAKIYLHGEQYGTVNFSSRHPHKKAFTDTDKDLVNLIGSWVSLALERQFAQEEIFKAKEHAEAANQSKSDFLANMSHELRTPLNAIIGYSELIEEDINAKKEKSVTSDLKKISSSGRHLLNLINDVLDLSKIEAGKMEFLIKEANISALITEVADTFGPALKTNNITLVTDFDENIPAAMVDATRLKQTLINLIGNAIKFTKNGEVKVAAGTQTRLGEAWITIEISDTGIGIPPEAIKKIFQPFQQVSKETSVRYGGTGLGLAISRRMCRMMGGDITAVSCVHEGSTFTIWLPIPEAENPADTETAIAVNN
ncbi:GAF domain-containing sensor histidine kinase [Kaarinaea lacus]